MALNLRDANGQNQQGTRHNASPKKESSTLMKDILLASAAALAMTTGVAFAQSVDFSFEEELDVQLNIDVTESLATLTEVGFEANGGALTAGNSDVKADLAATGALSAETISLDGIAFVDTDGNLYGSAEIGATANRDSFTAALSADFDRAKLDTTSLTQGAIAGTAGVTVTDTLTSSLDGQLNGQLEYDAGQTLTVTP